MTNKTYENKVAYLDFERINVTKDFVATNKFILKQDYDAIKIKAENCGMFGFEQEVLCPYIPYSLISDWYDESFQEMVKKGERIPDPAITDIYEAVQDFLDYMVFAWGKALDRRGISCSRSISKLGAWLWLLSREDLADLIQQDDLYAPYGIPALIAVCKALGIKYPAELDDNTNWRE